MATRPSRERSVGARSIGANEKKGGAWWKWLLALIVLLISLLSGGDDKKTTAAPATTSATTAAAATPAPAAAAPTLTAAGTSLFGLAAADLKTHVGQPATGTQDKVLSLTKSGFFVGSSPTDRVFVEYGGKVGGNEDKQTYHAKVGDTVDLKGPVRPAPENPGRTLKLESADAKTVTEQGAYVNASTVTPSS